MIRVPDSLVSAMKEHARRTYNEECCGVLFGRSEDASKWVEAVEPLSNARDGERHRRFVITAADYRRAEAEADTQGMELLGFYHSHPDHPARPSAYDLEHAWPSFSYVIISVHEGDAVDVRSYVLKEDRSTFLEEALVSGG